MTTTTEYVVIWPDIQLPLNDVKMTRALVNFVGEFQPTSLWQVGDLTDSTQLGRWSRGLKGQFDGGLEGGFAKTRKLLSDTRDVYDGPFGVIRSNHDDRLANAIDRYLPEIEGLTIKGERISIQGALDFDGFGVDYDHELAYKEIAPGWLITHGDLGSLSSQPGNTALLQAQQIGKSIVCGHTHRAGLVAGPLASDHQSIEVMGMEVGHAMDRKQATYLKGGRNNWHQAFGLLRVERSTNKKRTMVYPELVLVKPDYSFTAAGELWKGLEK